MGFCKRHQESFVLDCLRCAPETRQAFTSARTSMPFGPSTDYCSVHNRLFDRRRDPCCPMCMEATTQATRAGIKQSEPPPIYTIPARDVVPGMFTEGELISRVWREDGLCWAKAMATSIPMGVSDDLEEITLPGPSPRELCCTCVLRGVDDGRASPDGHLLDCPVAPIEGLHGGMRLWPAPAGTVTSWGSRVGRHGWCGNAGGRDEPCPIGVGVDDVAGLKGWLRRGYDRDLGDVILSAFFYPPAPPAEKPTAPGWDPYAELIDLAVRWG